MNVEMQACESLEDKNLQYTLQDTIHKALTMWFVADSIFFFAHLSRTNSISRSPLSIVLCRPHPLNIFSETIGPIEAKDHMKPSEDVKTKICIIGPGHITKMADMPIYGKNHKKNFHRTTMHIALKPGM